MYFYFAEINVVIKIKYKRLFDVYEYDASGIYRLN
jgi:hypothetical protein